MGTAPGYQTATPQFSQWNRHVSKQMLKHYSHVRMEAKRKALQGLIPQPATDQNPPAHVDSSIGFLQEVPQVTKLN